MMEHSLYLIRPKPIGLYFHRYLFPRLKTSAFNRKLAKKLSFSIVFYIEFLQSTHFSSLLNELAPLEKESSLYFYILNQKKVT